MIGNLKAKLDALARSQAAFQGSEPPKSETVKAEAEAVCRHECHSASFTEEQMARYRLLDGRTLSLLDRKAWPEDFDPMDTVFVDTETTGLSGGTGTVAFLIGVGCFEARGFQVEQCLMRDYDEEPDMLERLLALLQRHSTVVTYNGKSFDSPLLQNRGILNRIRMPLDKMAHIDLLHMARRLYKRSMPRCSLQAMEQALLGLTRVGDIPGGEIPEVFFAFLQDGDMQRLEQVIHHNQQDIESMVLLLGCFAEVMRAPQAQEDPCVRYSAALLLPQEERRALLEGIDLPDARLTLAQDLKREGKKAEALALWNAMIRTGQGGFEPYREAAMAYEHALKQPQEALRITELALQRQRIFAPDDMKLKSELERRKVRLKAKTRRM